MAQNAKKIKKHVRNIARLRFKNLQKRILTNQTIKNTTNETNVNVSMYKVYHILCVQMTPSTLSVTVETP